jgi:hypothetical protein
VVCEESGEGDEQVLLKFAGLPNEKYNYWIHASSSVDTACYLHPSLVFGNKSELEPAKVEPLMVVFELYPKMMSYIERD